MAFCNSCGATVEAGAKFCPKCGTGVPGNAAQSASAPPATPAPAQGSGALKIILIVVAVIVGIGVIGMGTAGYFIHRAVQSTHIEEKDGKVKVETPFATMESNTDPGEAARSLGVDIYPGAEVVKGSTVDMTMAGNRTSAATFECSDSASTVAEYYKARFPKASFVSADGDHYSIVAGDKDNLTTISIEPSEGKTVIHIARVTKGAGSTT